ncbi:MAG: hypothetical protein JRJ19_04815 [Deltaproteobacteria bacterium]|nr:hypothetical protein [Deltaproteobacteria bacterium]
MRQGYIFIIVSVLVLGLSSCSSSSSNGNDGGTGDGDGGQIEFDTITITGQVFLRSSGGGGIDQADGAQISASLDVNLNGVIDQAEKVSVLADSQGKFTLAAPAEIGRTTVVAFEEEGYAKIFRSVAVKSLSPVSLNGILNEMATLVCEGTSCRDESGSVSISGIEIASGYAKVFNPVTDADQFPGAFADSEGNLLVSAVFGAFELRDHDDNLISDLGAGETATITMKVPRDTWPVIIDMVPGDDRVSVPMYYFDETTGEWVVSGMGWLQDGNQQLISETQLLEVKDGSFSGSLIAVAEVTHFSYWNVDWPVEDNACIGGLVVDSNSDPVVGATGTVRGINFTGSSPPFNTDDQGKFCLDLMRSENPGEDLDQNGISGETHTVLTTFTHDNKMYRFDDIDITTDSASCPTGCAQLGNFELVTANEVQPEICTVSGTVYRDGAPVPDVMVWTADEILDSEIKDTVCAGTCVEMAATDQNGYYEVSTAYAFMLDVNSYPQVSDDTAIIIYEGRRNFVTCPTEPVDLNLEVDACLVHLPVIDYLSGTGQISWDPPITAGMLTVTSQTSGPRWGIASETGFSSPVTYATVPAGAVQSIPYGGGAPTPIEVGDIIMLSSLSGYIEYQGFLCTSMAQYEVE